MTRKALLTLTTATLIAGPALAESPQVSSGDQNDVASQQSVEYDTNSARISTGDAALDMTTIQLQPMALEALTGSVGQPLYTSEGETIGTIEGAMVNPQGNAELEVDLEPQSVLDAETLVIEVTPNNMAYADETVFLMTSVAELELKTRKNSVGSGESRVNVTLF